MRLDKFISETTEFSRRDAEYLVRKNRITINGNAAKRRDEKIDENHDVISVDGKEIRYRKFIYLMLNKPAGYLSATEDEKDPVVTDLIPAELKPFSLFPVGRLDKDTEGLLLLTNDGRFDHAMTTPKKNVFKRYYAELDRPAEAKDIPVFESGMVFRDFTAKPAVLEITEHPKKVFIEIAEGKFHQVKRMCEQVGKTVLYLKRVSIGPLQLDETLPSGGSRELTTEELNALKNAAGSADH